MLRRTVLKGLASTLVLPAFSSLAFGEEPKKKLIPPRRFVCVTFGNGVNEKHWGVKGDAKSIAFEGALQDFNELKHQILALKGLRLFGDKRVQGGSGHCFYFTNLLSGAKVYPKIIRAGTSLDQFLATRIGQNHDLPFMNLGIEPVRNGTIFGAAAVCASTVSWRSERSPMPVEIYPRQVFDTLFGVQRNLDDKSVLDYVLGDINNIRKDLNVADQRNIDEFANAVRELEQRITKNEKTAALWKPENDQLDVQRPSTGIPDSIPEHVRMMSDLLILALRMNKTRITTFILSQDVSSRSYGFIEGVSNSGLHALSHHGKDQGRIDQFVKTNRWHVAQVAYLANKMKSIDEGNGSLLDNTMLFFTPTMNDGDRHDPTNLTPLIIGGQNCEVKGGRVLSFTDDKDRRLCNLYVSIMNRMGIQGDSFGNSYHPLVGLS